MSEVSNSKRRLDDEKEEITFSSKKFAGDINNTIKGSENIELKDTECNEFTQNPDIIARASESDVGITEYISNVTGFNGILKERYSDFLVNEIDLKENVVRLTNLEKPSNPVIDNKLNELLKEDTLQKLKEFTNDSEASEMRIKVTDMDKNERKEIHVGLRQTYNNIDSSTEEKDGEKFIIVRKCSKIGNRFQPSSGGNYLHFVLYKENRDTIDTINTIASFLRVQPKVFSYAGTKDKRAKTSQLVSAYRMLPQKLLGINKHFQMIKVGNVEFKPEHIKLGDLEGNHFVIVLRQLQGSEPVVKDAMDSLSLKGFINYYGMQRFGTSCIPTHVIGRALLKGDWSEAIGLILTPKAEDDCELALAKKIWLETRDAKMAFEKLRRKTSIEAKLLLGLSTNKEKDFINAFNAVPRNMRLLYIHSYQSYIWNKVASKRIQKYGLKVLPGDLTTNDCSGEISKKNFDISREDNRKFVLSNMVKLISDQDIESFDITEILLPLPGHSVVYPENETRNWYDECLKSDGMSLDNFKSKTKSYSLSGDYRKLIVVPKNVKWKIIHYDDNTQPLALSDLDMLMGKSLPDFVNNGSLRALKVEMTLPSSSYATMALREVQKNDFCKKI